MRTAHSESAAELLCVELSRTGCPIDRPAAEQLIAAAAGPRPATRPTPARSAASATRPCSPTRPGRESTDLRNPAQVRELLAAVGVDVPDTRAGGWSRSAARTRSSRRCSSWRKAERIATTYGYRWLDAHVGPDGRLRGGWTACDGAAGRMTAQNGLHNLPAPLRPAVAAAPGSRVRPRRPRPDRAAGAGRGLRRPGLRRGHPGRRPLRAGGGRARRRAAGGQGRGAGRDVRPDAPARPARRSGPRARLPGGDGLPRRARTTPGVAARDVRTYGGRRMPTWRDLADVPAPAATPPATPARGRFARNAVIQGAAAELFKAWAATVRATTRDLGARIVLCLHDELLVHVPAATRRGGGRRVDAALTDGARRWAGSTPCASSPTPA